MITYNLEPQDLETNTKNIIKNFFRNNVSKTSKKN